MGIQFVDGADAPQEPIICTLYGVPSAGKTTLALSAPKPALLDFDGGVRRTGDFRHGKAVLPIKDWADVSGLEPKDVEPYRTVVVDTVGTCLDKLSLDIIRSDPKCGSAGSLNLKGYGVLKGRFNRWLAMLKQLNKHIVLIAHLEEQIQGEEVHRRIVAPGSSKQLIYQEADIMGQLFIERDGKRRLSFNPTYTSFGKNIGLRDYTIAPPGEAKDQMESIFNDAEKAMSAPRESPDDVRIRMAGSSVDDFNKEAARMTKENAPGPYKKALMAQAEREGFEFDKAKKQFVKPAPKPAPAATENREEDPF